MEKDRTLKSDLVKGRGLAQFGTGRLTKYPRGRFPAGRVQLCIKKSFEAAQHELSGDSELPVFRGMQAGAFDSCIQTNLPYARH